MIVEAALNELETLLLPLAEEAVADIVDLVKAVTTHKDGAGLAARRALQALAAKAFIES